MASSVFQLELPQLQDVRRALRDRIAEGLAQDDLQIRALPTFLGPPPRVQTGRALVVDTGGTNLRAAVVDLSGSPRVVAGPLGRALPDGRGAPVDAATFWEAHVDLISRLAEHTPLTGLPLGFCFSYPAASLPNRDARLLRWTKGVHVDGVEGREVGAELAAALTARGLPPGRVTVLNDTVAALLAGAPFAEAPANGIGLIVGTGHNLAAYLPGEALTKLPSPFAGPMAVNLESGNFAPPHLSLHDEALDGRSDNPGRQRLEKAVSGFYLARLMLEAHPELAGRLDPNDTRALAALGDAQDELSVDARAIVERSSGLVAAAVAGVVDHLPATGTIALVAEGGLFWGQPGYAARFEAQLRAILGHERVKLVRVEDANLFGAARAALA